jgi:hypothetical protein
MAQHRLVIDEDLARRESRAEDHRFSLLYQLSHVTRDRGSLKHDDRLDAVAGAVAHYQRSMGQDVHEAARGVVQQRLDEEMEDFVNWHESGGKLGLRGRSRDGVHTEVWMSDRKTL